ncbi:MAG: transcriptional activator RfaH [Alphaproteobacteria bacterium]
MREWFVVYTHPQKELTSCQHLQEQGFLVYLPRFKKTRRHARKVEEVLSPLFPRYLFVNLDITKDLWRSINGTRGVSYIISQDSKPIPIPESVITELQAAETQEGLVPLEQLSLFQKGDSVSIQEGVFKGHTAVFEKMSDKDRVELLLNFLGRDTKITVSRHFVDKD